MDAVRRSSWVGPQARRGSPHDRPVQRAAHPAGRVLHDPCLNHRPGGHLAVDRQVSPERLDLGSGPGVGVLDAAKADEAFGPVDVGLLSSIGEMPDPRLAERDRGASGGIPPVMLHRLKPRHAAAFKKRQQAQPGFDKQRPVSACAKHKVKPNLEICGAET
jgi:hypothetical protein